MVLTLRLATEAATADGSVTSTTVRIDDDGQEQFSRTIRLDITPTPREMAQLRWYLEDFPNHPFDPAPALAGAARTRMRELGAAMFTALRAAGSNPLLDWCLGPGLPETAVEVLGVPGSMAWELLRNPDTGQIPLVHARRMVRLVPVGSAAPGEQLPSSLRMLLVVSRPARSRDVPFQSVVRPLLSALGQVGMFDAEVLRPPSYPALLRLLSDARQAGRPIDLIHFDGHGLVHDGKGHLVFEGESADQPGVWIPGSRLGRDLAAADVRMAVLNACRSADVGMGEDATPAAFRSLAEELVLAGLGGVLAMQYDVRVDTAARFVGPLYTALGAGRPLGESATFARRELFKTMMSRQAEGTAAVIDDWFVPVVYEAQRPRAAPPAGPADEIPLTQHVTSAQAAIYDPAFHGRDDVLLQLDRAFDTAKIVDLCGLTGVGKTTAARQFGRWYGATGGVRGEVVVAEVGPAVAAPAEQVIAALGGSAEEPLGRFAGRPGLLIVDDLNALPTKQQDALNDLFTRLTAAGTRVLVTSYSAFWLEDAERIRLGGMTDVDMLGVLGDRLGTQLDSDAMQTWRPVLDLANGNPLALLILADWCQAMPEQSAPALRALVDDVLSGEVPPLPVAARPALETWPQIFLTQQDWQRLAALLHRQRYVEINELLTLGKPSTPEHLVEIENITGKEWAELFTRLSVGGLMWPAHNTYFELHPLFTASLLAGCGGAIDPERLCTIERSFAFIMNSVGASIVREFGQGSQRQLSLKWAASEEFNLRHALELARRRGWWRLILGPADALSLHYQATGRQRERAALIQLLAADVVAPDGGPVEGRADLWEMISARQRDLAVADGDLRAAYRWANRTLAYRRGIDDSSNIAVALVNLAKIEVDLDDPACIDHLAEAAQLADRTERDDQLLAAVHYHLGLAYQHVTAVRDLNRAYQEYGRSADLQHPNDHTNRAKCISQRAEILLQTRPDDKDLAVANLIEAMKQSVAALHLFPAEDVANQAVVQERIGRIYRMSGHWDDALTHDSISRTLHELGGDTFGQARSRLNVALDLQGLGRLDDCRVYAAASAQAFTAFGERGREGVELAQRLLAELTS